MSNDNVQQPQQTNIIKRIFGAISLIGILMFLALFIISTGLLCISPYFVMNEAGSTAPVNTEIVIKFSKDMNRSSVEDAFYLYEQGTGGKSISGTFDWPDGNVMVYRPNTDLRANAWHTVMINKTAKDAKGDQLTSDAWEFKTSSAKGTHPSNYTSPKSDVLSTSLPPSITERSPITLRGTLFLVTPWIVELTNLEGSLLSAWYVLVVLIILFCILYLFWKSGRVTGRILEFSLRRFQAPPEDTNNSLMIIVQVFLAVTSFQIMYVLLVGDTSGAPDLNFPPGTVMYWLANASVWEELIVRFLMIGLPLGVIYAARRGKILQGFFGGSGKFGGAEVFLILFSSVIFGIAHWLSGWGAWKIAPSLLAGLFMGYLFVKIGLHASIIYHFCNNFLDVPVILWGDFTAVCFMDIVILFMVFVGITYLLYYVKSAALFIAAGMGYKKPEPVSKENQPSPFGPQSPKPAVPTFPGQAEFGFRCLSCGWMEARYLGQGSFQCLRCGMMSSSRSQAVQTGFQNPPFQQGPQVQGGRLNEAGLPVDSVSLPGQNQGAPQVTITVSVGTEPRPQDKTESVQKDDDSKTK